jgi:hypothetical protein
MQSTGAKIALAVGAIAMMVVLFVVLQGGGDNSQETTTTTATTTQTTTTAQPKPAKPKSPTISIASSGEPVGGLEQLEFDSGEQIRFAVKSKIDDEVHVHGYDITERVPAGKKVTLAFKAKLEGVFEVESHTTGTQLAELRVSP